MPSLELKVLTVLFIILWTAGVPHVLGQPLGGDKRVADVLGPVRQKHNMPAPGGAIVTSRGLEAAAAIGVRRRDTDVAVTVDDKWHIGSDTKAMTATVTAMLVEQGKLKWEDTLAQAFPDLAASMRSELREVTVLHLLTHRAGLPANLPGGWWKVARTGSTREQRLAAVKLIASEKLESELGSKRAYSNLGYVVAGAMLEKAADASWEDLMARLLFQPLGMASAGFGGVGTQGQIDQPWPHRADGSPVAHNGPMMDNPQVMGPAGTVHCSLSDWAKFIADQLRGARGGQGILSPATYKTLHTPPSGGGYALGWGVTQRPWGGGTVLTHAGSNTMNYAVVWMAPLRDFAVLVTCNQGGDTAAKACDEAASALIRLHLKPAVK